MGIIMAQVEWKLLVTGLDWLSMIIGLTNDVGVGPGCLDHMKSEEQLALVTKTI